MPISVASNRWQKPANSPIQFWSGHPLGPSGGLQSLWLFNESAGLVVASATNGNRTTAGGTVAWTQGLYGSAMTFDGSTTGISSSADYTSLGANAYTALMLVRPASTSAGAHNIFATGIGNASWPYAAQLRRDAASWNLYHRYLAVDVNATAASVVANTWTWVAGLWDGVNISLAINGVVTGGPTSAAGIDTNNTGPVTSLGYDNVDVGTFGAGGGQFWDGDIALGYFYNRALTQGELQQIQIDPYMMCRLRPVRRWTGAAYRPTVDPIFTQRRL